MPKPTWGWTLMLTMEPGMFSNLLGRWEPCILVQSLADSVSTLYTAMWLLAFAVMRPSPFALKVKAVKGAESCRLGISEVGFGSRLYTFSRRTKTMRNTGRLLRPYCSNICTSKCVLIQQQAVCMIGFEPQCIHRRWVYTARTDRFSMQLMPATPPANLLFQNISPVVQATAHDMTCFPGQRCARDWLLPQQPICQRN